MLVMIVLIYTLYLQHSIIMFLNCGKLTHACTNILYEIPAQVDDFSCCNMQKQEFRKSQMLRVYRNCSEDL